MPIFQNLFKKYDCNLSQATLKIRRGKNTRNNGMHCTFNRFFEKWHLIRVCMSFYSSKKFSKFQQIRPPSSTVSMNLNLKIPSLNPLLFSSNAHA
jgi:hypothetical protein